MLILAMRLSGSLPPASKDDLTAVARRTFAIGHVLCLMIGLAGMAFTLLPDFTVASHASLQGDVDAYGSSSSLGWLAAGALVGQCAFVALARVPHRFNFPYPLSPENAHRQYRFASEMLAEMALWWQVLAGAMVISAIFPGLLPPAAIVVFCLTIPLAIVARWVMRANASLRHD